MTGPHGDASADAAAGEDATQAEVVDRIRSLDPDSFHAFVADLWTAAGWHVRDDGDVFVATRASDHHHERIVLAPIPPPRPATADDVSAAVRAGDERDVDGVTTVTSREYTTGALSVGDAYGVDAVGPDAAARFAVALNAADRLL